MANERVKMVPWGSDGFSPAEGLAIASVRCEEFIDAGIGKTAHRIIRRLEEQVSDACDTPDLAWASYRERQSHSVDANQLVHGIAYSAACTMIESECVWRGAEGVGWFDVSIENFGDDDVLDSVKYLEARGLIVRHPENRDWIQMRDESEATV